MSQLATISDLYIYPIKSCGGISMRQAYITKYGLASVDNPQVVDRKWMIVDENNVFISQRSHPHMALIQVAIDGDFLVLNAPKMQPIKVTVQAPKNKFQGKCKDSQISGYSYGGEVAKWLSEYLLLKGADLVSFDEEFDARRIKDMKKNYQIQVKDTDVTMFSDYSQFMLMSEASLNDLNTKTPFKVSFLNFRPNIMVNDCEKYSEDLWMKVKMSNATFRKTRNCTRCLLTTVDPITGVKHPEQEPLRTLRTYRIDAEIYGLSPLLGINLVTDCEDLVKVCVGDGIFNSA